MSLPAEFRQQTRTQLEMQGMHLAKVLRALRWLRKERGRATVDRPEWTTVAAEVAAAIVGPAVDAKRVAGMCVRIGFDPDPDELLRAAKKARLARADPGYKIMSSAIIGRLVSLTSEEKAFLADRLRLKKIFIIAIDAADARRERQREAAAAERRARNIPARSESASARAKLEGVHRSTIRRRDATVTSPLPMGAQNELEMALLNATVTSPLPGKCDSYVAAPLSTEVGDVCVALDDPPGEITTPVRRRAS